MPPLPQATARRRRRAAEQTSPRPGPRAPADIAGATQRRDENDRTRQASPLSIAADATVIETTGMLIPEVISAVLAAVREREAEPSGAAGSLTANTNRRSVLRDS